MAPPNWRGIWYPKGFDTDIRDERSSAMCGRLCPCGVAAPRLSFAGCPCPRWCRVRCAGERPPVGRPTGIAPGCRVSFPGLRVTSVRRVPRGVIGWSGSQLGGRAGARRHGCGGMTGMCRCPAVIGMGGCKRICKRDAAGRAGPGETSRDRRRWPARVGRGQDGPGETVRDAGDGGRMAHSPEVAG
jgi:hypothetical protein